MNLNVLFGSDWPLCDPLTPDWLLHDLIMCIPKPYVLYITSLKNCNVREIEDGLLGSASASGVNKEVGDSCVCS